MLVYRKLKLANTGGVTSISPVRSISLIWLVRNVVLKRINFCNKK